MAVRALAKRTGARGPEPDPERLVDFACACVWRGSARGGVDPARQLGPYAERIRRRIFDGRRGFDPPLLIHRLGMLDATGDGLNMAILPTRWNIREKHFWRFSVCGLVFDLQLVARPTPLLAEAVPMNGRTTVLILLEPGRDVPTVPSLMAAMHRMLGPSSSRRP